MLLRSCFWDIKILALEAILSRLSKALLFNNFRYTFIFLVPQNKMSCPRTRHQNPYRSLTQNVSFLQRIVRLLRSLLSHLKPWHIGIKQVQNKYRGIFSAGKLVGPKTRLRSCLILQTNRARGPPTHTWESLRRLSSQASKTQSFSLTIVHLPDGPYTL